MPLPIFKEDFVTRLRDQLKKGNRETIERFRQIPFPYEESDTVTVSNYQELKGLKLLDKNSGGDSYEFHNSIAIYEKLTISPYEASNPGLWSYLTLVTFRDYTALRSPFPEGKMEEGDLEWVGKFLARHYLCDGAAVSALLLNDISLLWWVAHLTVQKDKENRDERYRLTRELFSMLDYTRHLLPGTQGRSEALRHAVLEFVVENPDLFEKSKAEKVRFVMRRLNSMAGYQLFPFYSKAEIKDYIRTLEPELDSGKFNE